MNDKLIPEDPKNDDVGQKHMRVEAALTKLIQDYPNSGGKALIDVQKGIAQPIQIDMLAHPDRAMATPEGQLTELGEEALKSLQKKINEILQFDSSRKTNTPSIEKGSVEPEQAVKTPHPLMAPRQPLRDKSAQPKSKPAHKTKPDPEIG